MFKNFLSILEAPLKSVERFSKETDRKPVIVFPGYFPVELIYAYGFLPVRLWEGGAEESGGAEAPMQSFACSLGHSIAAKYIEAPLADSPAYAFTILCDTMQNLREIFKLRRPDMENLCFILPASSDPKMRRKFVGGELKVARAQLEKAGGKTDPKAEAEAARLYNEQRKLFAELYAFRREFPAAISNTDFYAVIEASDLMPVELFNRELELLLKRLNDSEKPKPSGKPPVTLLASGVIPRPKQILKTLDNAGIIISDDDFLYGRRRFLRPPLEALDEASYDRHIFEGGSCPFLYIEGKSRVEDIERLALETKPSGVVFWRIKFCEPEAFEFVAMKALFEKLNIPLLLLEVELDMKNIAGLETRIESFAEMLKE